ncbi:MAG: prepilin-type N-terminal cleavage/methylation domain-containing protein [Desulfobacteraceae bacterium]|nr:MAG: prepilin-type N-terminal cleavage/methylation domain-containing protein [Desulfobacteraceae bacterium]
MRRDSGFTALEVAVTLAMIAVLASITMPSFLGWLSGHRLRGAAINLMADIETAKIRAMRENAFVAVQFTAGGYSIFVDNGAGAGTAGDWVRNGTERLVQDRPLPSGVTVHLAELNLANNRVRFTGRGIPADLAAEALIPVENTAGRRAVHLNRLGRVWIQ